MIPAGCAPEEILRLFEAGEIPAPTFRHADHVKAAFALLKTTHFSDAVARYAAALRSMEKADGRPNLYNCTITIAFLAVIAEKMERTGAKSWDELAARSPELFDKDILNAYYEREELHSDAARRRFVMPWVAS